MAVYPANSPHGASTRSTFPNDPGGRALGAAALADLRRSPGAETRLGQREASAPGAESLLWWSSSASIRAPPTRAMAWWSRAGGTLAALDGGVIEHAARQPLERRLAHIHAARVRPDRRAPSPRRVAVEDLFFGQNARTRLRGRPGARRRAARRGPGGHSLLLVHAAGGEAGGLRQRRGRQGPGAAHGRARCCRCPSRPSPTTRRTPSRWRSATPTARRCGRRSDDRARSRGEPSRSRPRRRPATS